MQKTTHYQLNQWEVTDRLSRKDFNQDNAVIDAALAAKAEKSAVTAVETALANYKTSNDAAVAQKAEQSVVTALENTVAGKGNCQIVSGSYTGSGKKGSTNPNTLSFDFQPMFLCVVLANDIDGLFFMRPSTISINSQANVLQVTWGTNSVSWYSTYGEEKQYNQEGVPYYYMAFGVTA